MTDPGYYPRSRPKVSSVDVTADLGIYHSDASDPIGAVIDDGDRSDHRSNVTLD